MRFYYKSLIGTSKYENVISRRGTMTRQAPHLLDNLLHTMLAPLPWFNYSFFVPGMTRSCSLPQSCLIQAFEYHHLIKLSLKLKLQQSIISVVALFSKKILRSFCITKLGVQAMDGWNLSLQTKPIFDSEHYSNFQGGMQKCRDSHYLVAWVQQHHQICNATIFVLQEILSYFGSTFYDRFI